MNQPKLYSKPQQNKWFYRFLIISLVSLASCKNRTSCKTIDHKKVCTTTYKNGKRERCTTNNNQVQYCETRYPNGKIASYGHKKAHYADDVRKNGIWVWKYKNGKTKRKCNFTQLSSNCKSWYEDGKKASERVQKGYFRNEVVKLLKWDWSGEKIVDCQKTNQQLNCKLKDQN